MHDNIPAHFEFFSGGFFGPNHVVTLSEGRLDWRKEEPVGHTVEEGHIQPSAEAWQGFWREMDRLGFWDWDEYYSADILDGHQWSFEVQLGKRFKKTGGSNAYPMKSRQNVFEQAFLALRVLLPHMEL